MERQLLILLVSAVALAAAGKHDIYSRDSVYRIQLRDVSDQELINKMEVELDVDVWQYGMPEKRDTMLMLTASNKNAALAELKNHGVQYQEEISNVTRFLDQEDEQLTKWRRQRSNSRVFEDYARYSEINEYMESLASQYPNLVQVVTAGPSYEGRPIKYLKISTTNFEDRSKPIYLMGAMLHAREWVTTPVTLYSMHRLVESLRDEDSDLRNDIDWIIIPLINADGYEFSHTDQRLWRKTRSVSTVDPSCIGVDANRNFDVFFNQFGTSSNPCAITYAGTHAFSEPETAYVRDIIHENLDRIQIYLDIHSHGNYMLFPYGDTSLPPNVAPLHHIAAAMGAAMDAIKIPKAPHYLIGNSALVLYGASGCADDYGQLVGIPFSYCLELPGYEYSFSVPPEYLGQINEETWRAIGVSARYARAHYRARTTSN